jgi:plasmid stability protein
MTEIVLRDVDEAIVERLSERARRNGRTLEDETKAILLRAATADMETAREAAGRIRTSLAGRQHSDSAEIVAEDRQR